MLPLYPVNPILLTTSYCLDILLNYSFPSLTLLLPHWLWHPSGSTPAHSLPVPSHASCSLHLEIFPPNLPCHSLAPLSLRLNKNIISSEIPSPAMMGYVLMNMFSLWKSKKKKKITTGFKICSLEGAQWLSVCLWLRPWPRGPGIESRIGSSWGACFSLCLCLCLCVSHE